MTKILKTDEIGFRLFGRAIFGFYLPFIGYEDIVVDVDEYFRDTGVRLCIDNVAENTTTIKLFTLEWFGYGISLGKVSEIIKNPNEVE